MKKHLLRILPLALTLSLALTSLTGCGILGKPSASGSVAASGQNISGTSGTSNGGAVNPTVSGDAAAWPKEKMGDLVRPNAPITAVVSDDVNASYIVAFADMSKEDAEKYVENLKTQGYTAITELTDAQGILFVGQNAAGSQVTFAYDFAEKDGSVTYVSASGNPGASTPNPGNSTGNPASVDMTDVSPWPASFLADIPELAGKITNVLNQNDDSVTVDLEYVEKKDFETFVAALKTAYADSPDETKDSYTYDYTGYNANGDYVSVSMNYEQKTASVYLEKSTG